jgi:hypothetical protein
MAARMAITAIMRMSSIMVKPALATIVVLGALVRRRARRRRPAENVV